MQDLKILIDAYAKVVAQTGEPAWASTEGRAVTEYLERIQQVRYKQGSPVGWALKDAYGRLHLSEATADKPNEYDYEFHAKAGETFVEVFLGPAQRQTIHVDDLAQEIRRVDGNHSMGAAALAEALMPFVTSGSAQSKA